MLRNDLTLDFSNITDIGSSLQHIRQALKITVAELSRTTGLRPETIRAVESGQGAVESIQAIVDSFPNSNLSVTVSAGEKAYPDLPLNEVKDAIKQYRKFRGLSYSQVGKLAGVGYSAAQMFEKSSSPRLSSIEKYATAMQLDMNFNLTVQDVELSESELINVLSVTEKKPIRRTNPFDLYVGNSNPNIQQFAQKRPFVHTSKTSENLTAQLGDAMRSLRLQNGMSKSSVAIESQISFQTLVNAESHRGTFEVLSQIAQIFGKRLTLTFNDGDSTFDVPVFRVPVVLDSIRGALGLSYAEMSRRTGFHVTTIVEFPNHVRTSEKSIVSYANALGLEVGYKLQAPATQMNSDK